MRAQVPAEKMEETEVPVLKRTGWDGFRCGVLKNAVIADEQKLKEIVAGKNCSSLKALKIDFTKQTLIVFTVQGDCMVGATAKVFRSDSQKKYNVRIKNIWGGCRAAGSFQGWLVIEKILPGYTAEFTETRVESWDKIPDEDFAPSSFAKSRIIETRKIDLKGCIQTLFDKQFIITKQDDFLKEIRNDAGRGWCLKNLEKIDFDEYTLLGIELNTGYCRTPPLDPVKAVREDAEKQYVLNISYIEPQEPCRALSGYDLWLLVPKLPDNYKVKFEVKGKERSKINQ